ncbi:MAG: DEAD/DEAH box helicase [Desulfurococcales archaeon ex4484_58]|nr:MAG: DEAD/DEAH box helicase [Desulfurococcales archaeon ex4484_58]
MKNKDITSCLEKLGYKRLTDLQKKVFREIVSCNRSVIIVAPTGSGKTEAALFPIMYLIRKNQLKPIATIYITPLRALNRDIEERIERIAECFEVSVSLRHGDTSYSLRKNIEKNPPQILVTTPETLNYLVINDKLRSYLKNLQFIVIDEFRELIESKRGLLLFTVIYLLEHMLGRKIRKIALTATLKNEEDSIRILEGSLYTSNVVVIRDESAKKFVINIIVPNKFQINSYIDDLMDITNDERVAHRIAYLINILSSRKGTLIFTNTRSLAERLGFILSKTIDKLKLPFKIGVHHGSLSRTHRVSVEKTFKKGEIRGLVATSSMELGIDIGTIDYVIQYMSPRQATRLLQRIGRSGHRLGGVSRGDIIVYDNLYQVLESIVLTRRALNYDLEKERIYKSPLDVLAYAIAVHTLINPSGIPIYDLFSYLINHPLYQELDLNYYHDLIKYLEYARIVKIKENKLYPTRKTRLYVYRTTMIPNTRDVNVIEISSGKQVGVLNEEYVVLNLSEGDKLVLGGKLWKIIGYDEDNSKLYVEPYSVSTNEILVPHWEGENIPVEYRVAREVGSLIRRIKDNNEIGIYSKYQDLLDKIMEHIYLFGNDKEIIIDYCEEPNMITINIHGGTKVNRLLRDLLKSFLSIWFPFIKFDVYSMPYAVIVKIDQLGRNYVNEIINKIEYLLINLEEYIDPNVLKDIVKKQNTLLWRIYQVAQRFGAFDPRKTKVTRNIIEGFIDTIIGIEAFKEVLFKDYDLESAHEIAKLIKRGSIRIIKRITSAPNKFHYEILNYIEVPITSEVKPFDPSEYKERLMNRKVSLLCIKCGYLITGKLKDLVESSMYSCPRCGSKTLAPIKGDGAAEREIIVKNISGEKLRKDEKRVLEDLRKRAILFIQFRELALIALSSRGVGVTEAIRVLNKVMHGSDLYKELYESEKKFVKVKKYIK